MPTPEMADTEPTPQAELAPAARETQVAEAVSLADLAPQPEPVPTNDEVIVTLAVEPQNSPLEPASDGSVAEEAPQPEQPRLAELEPQPETLPTTDETIAALPVELPIMPRETASDVSVAGVRPESEVLLPTEDAEERSHLAAVADPAPAVARQALSRHDRKVLRKAAQLEKKKDRLVKHGRIIVVCR